MLIFAQVVKAQPLKSKANKYPGTDQKSTAVYFLKYYYEEEPGKIIFSRATGRSVAKDGSFSLIDYQLTDLSKPSFSLCFDAMGMPTQYGNEKEITNVYKDSVRLNFRGKDTTILITAQNKLSNPTNLWFWKYMPQVNETVVVGSVRKNFITNKIDIVDVAYTYMGKVKINVLGKVGTYYLVKNVPLNGSEGVYDERWYDKKGMMVKERHVVGKDGVRIGELTQIVEHN